MSKRKASKNVCQICGKGIMRGHKVSHAKNRSKKISKANLKRKRVEIKGRKMRILICTKCIKRMKKDAVKPSSEKKTSEKK